jgi:hypothetical protein
MQVIALARIKRAESGKDIQQPSSSIRRCLQF